MRTAFLPKLAVVCVGLSILSFASKKHDQAEDFSLQVHIVRVDVAQGQQAVRGSGHTDSNGNYNSHVGGGGSYLYHLYIVHIDGDLRELTMTTRENASLHLGDYKGHWNQKGSFWTPSGSLEVQFLNEKGELKHQSFFIEAESPLNTGK